MRFCATATLALLTVLCLGVQTGCSDMLGDDQVVNETTLTVTSRYWTQPNGDFVVRGFAHDPRGIKEITIEVRGECREDTCTLYTGELFHTHSTQTDDDGFFSVETNIPEERGRVMVTAHGGTGERRSGVMVQRDDPNDDEHIIFEADDLDELVQSCDGACTTLDGSVLINQVPSLENLDALSGVETIDGYLAIANNPDLESLEGVESLREINGSFSVGHNPLLKSLQGLDNLSVTEDLDVYNNPELRDLDALASLERTNDISIKANESLERLPRFNALASVVRLNILENPALNEPGSFPSLTTVEDVDIEDNPELGSLPDFESITYSETTEASAPMVHIRDNPSLENLQGLESLEVARSVSIVANESLRVLDGLDQLHTLQGSLRIQGNESLESIQAMGSLVEINGSLDIERNPSLPNWQAEQLAEDVSIGYEVNIADNGGC